MKKLLFLLLLPIFHSLPLLGQTITPDKVWHIESGYACPDGEGTSCFCYYGLETIKVGEIKTFNGKQYYELLSSFSNQQWETVTYVREEEGKVFFYTQKCDKEYLMYDFNLNIGDEITLVDPLFPTSHFNKDNPCELTEDDLYIYTFKVTDVDEIEYNQEKRKRLRLENLLYPKHSDTWVEGVGCMRGVVYHVAQQISGVHQLKDCYESNELIFTNKDPEYCWVSTTNINDICDSSINIFTDENNVLHIVNAKEISLVMYDLQGQKIQSFLPLDDNYETNISFLPKGIYIISNIIENINTKIIVK